MYKIMVREISTDRKKPGNILALEACRISALSSADYCLRDRQERSFRSFAWKGTVPEIRRLFEAERLDGTFLDFLEPNGEYEVSFLGNRVLACA